MLLLHTRITIPPHIHTPIPNPTFASRLQNNPPYIVCTLLLRLHLLNVLPFHQNRISKRHQRRIRQAFVMMGGTNPDSIDHGVMNLLKP